MLGWILQGLRTRRVTTKYPRGPEPQPDGVRNLLVINPSLCEPVSHGECTAVCPTAALRTEAGHVWLDLASCVQCGRCVAACPSRALSFTGEYEVAVRKRQDLVTEVGPV